MNLSTEQIQHLGNLARLRLSQKDLKIYATELNDILGYIERLNEVDTGSVEPTAQVTGLEHVVRIDKISSCEESIRDGLIQNFPHSRDDLLSVPPVFETYKKQI